MRFRQRLVSLVAALFLFVAGVEAQQITLDTFTLPNGLRVVFNEDHSAPLIAFNVWYHVGSKNERVGRTGFAHLFEHMLFSGSQNVGNNEHFRYVESAGGLINGTTSFDRTNYFETLPSNYLELGLWLESDRMGYFLPALDQKKLDIQKEVVKEERRQRYDNVPYGTALERMLRLGFPADYPYHWPTIGAMSDLTAAQLDDVKEFFRTYYSPNNAVLTLVGDFDPAEARRLVEKYFGDIPRGPAVPPFTAVLPPQGKERREVFPSKVQLPRVYRLYHVPKIGEREWFAADLFSSILAGDKSSRLHRSLVLEKQIAQDVNAFIFPSEGTSMLYMWATAKQGVSPETLEAAIDEEIARLRRNGVTAKELTRAKNQNETSFAQQLGTFGSRADAIGMATTYFGTPTMINEWLGRYASINRDDLQRLAVERLVPENRVTLHMVPDRAVSPRQGGVE